MPWPSTNDWDPFNLQPLHNGYLLRRFIPVPSRAKPEELFWEAQNRCSVPENRFIHIHDPDKRTQLIYVDGACIDNGKDSAQAGIGIYFFSQGRVARRIAPGPNGVETSNRAELQAAIIALGLRAWQGEGFGTTVLATDSEYLVLGATEYYRAWRKNGWKTAKGEHVKNRDLWEFLLAKLEERESEGIMTQFWLIPREWNEVAHALAKKGALETDHVIPPGGKVIWMPSALGSFS